MCSPHPHYNSGRDFLRHVQRDHAKERRRRDGWGSRSQGDMCYAYSRKTGDYYVGYSGSAGGIMDGEQQVNTDQSDRRVGRLVGAVREIEWVNPVHAKSGRYRAPANCAEASALSIALSWDQELQDLFFVSFFKADGNHREGVELKGPCELCLKWIEGALGYSLRYENFVCKDDHCGGGGSGSNRGGNLVFG